LAWWQHGQDIFFASNPLLPPAHYKIATSP
jgi:hypothetical protein